MVFSFNYALGHKPFADQLEEAGYEVKRPRLGEQWPFEFVVMATLEKMAAELRELKEARHAGL